MGKIFSGGEAGCSSNSSDGRNKDENSDLN